MAERTPVVVVHASRLIRDGLADIIRVHPELSLAGAFPSGSPVLERADGPGVLLYDHATARQDGPPLLLELHRRRPELKVLVFNVADDDGAIIECVRVGAAGCMLQDASLDDLVAAISALASGIPPASPRVLTSLFSYVARLHDEPDAPPPTHLTSREEQVLAFLAEGLSNKEIADRLVLQPQTVKNYVHIVLQKLALRSRLDVIRALRPRR